MTTRARQPTQPRSADSSWLRALRATCLLAAIAASAALFATQFALEDLAGLLRDNALDRAQRMPLLVVPALAVLVALVAAGVFIALRGRRAINRLHVCSRVLAPLLLLATVPPLCQRQPAWTDELRLLLLLGVTALALERLVRLAVPAWRVALRPLRRWRHRRRPSRAGERLRWALPFVVVGAAVVAYGIVTSRLTTYAHARLETSLSDLGEFDNLFFNALHGHPFRAPAIDGELENWSALRVHAEFVLYLLLPLYSLRPGPLALLHIQSWVIALGALPVFLLARRRLGAGLGALLALAYLLLPAVERANYYDFHFTPLGMVFVLWTLYLLDVVTTRVTRGWRQRAVLVAFGCAFALALLSREEFSFGLLVTGVVALAAGRRIGLPVAALSLAYLVSIRVLVMQRFGSMPFDDHYRVLKAAGWEQLSAIVVTLFSNPAYVASHLATPEKLLYVLHLSVPLAGVWLRRPVLLLAALPGLPFTLLATDRPPLFEVSFQYVYFWIPYVFVASIYGLDHIARRSRAHRQGAAVAIAFATLVASFQYGALLGNRDIPGGFAPKHLTPLTADERERFRALRRLVGLIPPEASVAATEPTGPQVSTRLVLYSLKRTLGKDTDYVLFGAMRRDETQRVVEALRSRRYGVVAAAGEFVLLRRGAPARANDELLRRLGTR